MRDRWLAAVGVVVPILVTVAFLGSAPAPRSESTYSFETDWEGWAPDATDIAFGNCTAGASAGRASGMRAGNCTVDWLIERTTEQAHEGAASVKLFLNNTNDEGKIWIERAFNVTTGRSYRVHVAFAFASADFGSVNHWMILTGALSEQPRTADDLTGMNRGNTGNGLDAPGGYVWSEKGYDSTVAPGAGGCLWVLVGVWGTWETPRTYYVDAIQVTIEAA